MRSPTWLRRLRSILVPKPTPPARTRPRPLGRAIEFLEDRSVPTAIPGVGALDPTFGTGGSSQIAIAGAVIARAAAVSAVQPDGKVVVAGDTGGSSNDGSFALARYAADGTLDPTFGTGGRVRTDVGGATSRDSTATGVVVLPDGMVLVAGYVFNTGTNYDFALARYTADGSLDSTFGTGGQVTVDYAFGSIDQGAAVAVQGDGRIVVAGGTFGGSGTTTDIAVMRFHANGTLDGTFGSGGKVKVDVRGTHDGAAAVGILADNSVVLGGGAAGTGGSVTDDFAVVRLGPTGARDFGFGAGGIVLTDFGGNLSEGGTAMVVQPDGKVVLAGRRHSAPGTFEDFALARYNANGTLDAAFGTGGLVTTDFAGTFEGVHGLTLLPDGRLVAVGRTGTGFANKLNFAAARYNADGTLDATFDGDGRVVTDMGSIDDQAEDAVVRPDGRLVVVGRSGSAFALAGYDAAGALDPTFGTGGKAYTTFTAPTVVTGEAMAVQPDGRVLIAGSSTSGTDVAVARQNADGTPDLTFGVGGTVVLDFGGSENGYAVALQPDGKILVGGARIAFESDFVLARLNPDGTLDPTFGTGGKVVTNFETQTSGGFTYTSSEELYGLALQPDGKIVAVGRHVHINFTQQPPNAVVARYNANGTLDTTFASGGRYVYDAGGYEVARAVAVQPNGRIVIGGVSGGSNEFNGKFTLLRLHTNGAVDFSFNSFGVATTTFSSPSDVRDVAVLPDGKILAGGRIIKGPFSNGGTDDLALAKYLSNGTLDAAFGTGGKVTTDFGGTDVGGSLAVQPDGKILLAGNQRSGNRILLARYNPDGSPDTTLDGDGANFTTLGTAATAADLAVDAAGRILVAGSGSSAATTKSNFLLVRFTNPDGDGVDDAVEAAAPNGGDGNADGVPDGQQVNVTSLPNSADAAYVTLATPTGTTLAAVEAVANPAPATAPANVAFPVGFLDFRVQNVAVGAATTVTLFLPGGADFNTYYKYGPTAADPTPHWYEFLYDGTTGAMIDTANRTITLHYVDGQRGDDDLTANGVVVDPGAPAEKVNSAPTAIALSNAAVRENSPTNTVVGDFSTTDPDADDTFAYTLLDSAGGRFKLVGSQLVVNNGLLDFEATTSHVVTVRTTDAGGLSTEQAFTITVGNVAEFVRFDVQRGATQRSFVRHLAVDFASLDDLSLMANLRLARFNLDGSGTGDPVSLVNLTIMIGLKPPGEGTGEGRLEINFGSQGIGGNRNANAGNGYYVLSYDLDQDGNGTYETPQSLKFYRLFGNVNADRTVTTADTNQILAAYGQTGDNLESDVNGDGVVNAQDRGYAARELNKFLNAGLHLDD